MDCTVFALIEFEMSCKTIFNIKLFIFQHQTEVIKPPDIDPRSFIQTIQSQLGEPQISEYFFMSSEISCVKCRLVSDPLENCHFNVKKNAKTMKYFF